MNSKISQQSYIGYLDNISSLEVTGWAYNKDNPEERVEGGGFSRW